ncbi:protein kinase [Histoplasma capsulatum G186AR]|uniref:Protein kinase n=1 Tax=Ajellomyces capsulatus (strain G186AR / H82 / ATCC MYA-2454 / RMSCC 2432) TaxID=447093 RepID=C0NCZ7_AJECG|nr:protein kinase [Histoplasma capsulatum G186AR]EEH11538.1 protein kinase [Histoplasma capsulatum G186AR]
MMSRFGVWGNSLLQKLLSSKNISTVPSFVSLPRDTLIEEETLPYYKPEQYYAVNIGDVYNARYHIAGKLGYGAYSTNWLCQDLQDNKYRVSKVSTMIPEFSTATERELKIYEHLSQVDSTHPGQSLIRELYDSFDLQGSAGKHHCLILQSMHMTLLEMMRLNPRPFDLPLLKLTLKRLLLALDFLHNEAGIIHTESIANRGFLDLKTDNLMLTLEDDTMLADFAKAEAKDPSPRKQVDQSRTIYRSRRFRRPLKGNNYGLPILCDFGEARIGRTQESGPFVQPHIYRAPEIIFEMPWGSAVDIWNVWDLFEGEHLFGDIFDTKGSHDPFKHLARMVALIGPPPSGFVNRSETTYQCFDSNGAWIAHKDTAIPAISLESIEKRLSGQEKESFIQFLKSMLKWLPEERKTAAQLLEDPWLL